MQVRLRAFAKVNYALEVKGLRADGYHDVSTVMQSISLADEVEIEQAERGFDLQVKPTEADLGPLEANTAYRAWALLCDTTGHDLPARVRLHKKIPDGAGLGGGSADAAAVLAGLNELFGLGLRAEELMKIGSRIGADVPFCISGGTALGEGIGDVLTPLPAPPPHFLVLAKPAQGAETAKIYRAYDELPAEPRSSVGPAIEALHGGDLSMLARAAVNDLAPITRKLMPEVERLERELLRTGALGAAMTGTGSAVFGIFGAEEDARAATRLLKAPFAGVFEPVERGAEFP